MILAVQREGEAALAEEEEVADQELQKEVEEDLRNDEGLQEEEEED